MNDGALAEGILAGQRRALARGITLVESSRPDQARAGQELLETLLPHAGRAVRLGISGAPGVGKSTFVEALGLHLLDDEQAGVERLAVLAVDPSSPLSGGSILGDKTRMEELGRREAAFIRPSPSQGALGGVARRTREAMLLCEAAGFDLVVVETVGVGQSEVDVASMVDTFLLLLQPAAGDALQGVKRGVLELADLVVVNKADGELATAAARTRQQYELGLGLLAERPGGWRTPALTCSALTAEGLGEVWAAVRAHRSAAEASGAMAARREDQAERWMWSVVHAEVERRLHASNADPRLIDDVRAGRIAPTLAALRLVDSM